MSSKKALTAELPGGARVAAVAPQAAREPAAAPRPRPWQAWAVAAAVGAAALLLRPLISPVIGSGLSFVLAYPATMIAAWYGGFWPGAAVTVLGAAAMPWMAGVPWDEGTFGRIALYLPFGLLVSALCQSLHDARSRLERRAQGLEAMALSEQRLSTALAATGVSLFDLDAQLRYAWVKNMPVGLDAQAMLGKTALDIFPGEQAEAMMRACREVLASGSTQRVELDLSGPQGSASVDGVMVPLRDAAGAVIGVRAALTDATGRRAERERHRREQELFRVAQDQSLDPFEVLRPVMNDGRIVDFIWEYINPAGAAFFGRSPESMIGQRLLSEPIDRFHAARCAHWIEVMEQGVPRRADISREERGGPGWYQTLSVSLGDRLAATTRDATAQTRWLQAERAARAELQRAAKVKDEFLANLSHELRTPLNAIVGWAHLLGRAGTDPAMMQRAAEAISRNARAQAALVDDLLDMNQIITGTLRVTRQRCELQAVLLRAVDAVGDAAQAKWIRVDTQNVAPDLACLGDPDRLVQVFVHLLTNAVKHTPLNGSIRITAVAAQRQAQIEIADSGEGIAPEVLPELFHRFQQADESMSRPHGGLGLGLTIVRSLVELHGGEVSIASAGDGQGTTVFVSLPLAEGMPGAPAARLPASEPQQITDAPQAGSADEAENGIAVGPLTWRRILVLEDEADSLELMSVLLRQQGAIVRAFDNAEQALAAAENGSFDLVISDLGMPGMNGLEFMRRLKRRPLPVKAIALTAYAGDLQREQALEAGFTRVEIKPVPPPRFLEIVLEEIGREAGTPG